MNDVHVLTGPTGSGKSELGVALAERLEAEIVALDSMTLYRGMDIGTAKPDADQQRRVPHHLIDVMQPWESASVAWWLQRAQACCDDIRQRGKRVLFVGGTPLYLKALLHGLFGGPPADADLRRRLEQEAIALGRQALHDRLALIDPTSAGRLHPNDQRRVIRALEVFELTSRPISDWQRQWERQGDKGTGTQGDTETEGNSLVSVSPCLRVSVSPNSVLWLDRPRAELYARIDGRVRRMIDAGLIDEVRALRQSRLPLSKEAAQALGYKEMFAYLDGGVSLEETVQRIQTRTRNFAKRQMTWFRHMPECRPVNEELTFQLWTT